MILEDALNRLTTAMSAFSVAGAHKIPDVILYNMAIDVQEQARAVILISSTIWPRAGYANARAALEAAIDARYLVEDESQYNRLGARARVFELFSSELLQRRAGGDVSSIAGTSESVEQSVSADAAAWDADAPGTRTLLIQEYESCLRNPPGIGDHWSGLSRYARYQSIAAATGGDTQMPQMLDTTYGYLSRQAHPGPRTSDRTMSIDATNAVVFSGKPADVNLAKKSAAFAVSLMLSALQRRRELRPPS